MLHLETNRNEIVSLNEPLFNYICAIINGNDVSSGSFDEKTIAEYAELKEAGYLSVQRVETVENPLTENAVLSLERATDRIMLQVTRQCNLRSLSSIMQGPCGGPCDTCKSGEAYWTIYGPPPVH